MDAQEPAKSPPSGGALGKTVVPISFSRSLRFCGGKFPSSSAKVTTWPSPTFSAVNILRESGGSDNYRPMNSDGHPLSLKEKLNRMATGLAAKLSSLALLAGGGKIEAD